MKIIEGFEKSPEVKAFNDAHQLGDYTENSFGYGLEQALKIHSTSGCNGEQARDIGNLWVLTKLIEENAAPNITVKELESLVNSRLQQMVYQKETTPIFLRKIYALAKARKKALKRAKYDVTNGNIKLSSFAKLLVVFP